MHEFKHGELRIRGTGPRVKNPKQAIAIALARGRRHRKPGNIIQMGHAVKLPTKLVERDRQLPDALPVA